MSHPQRRKIRFSSLSVAAETVAAMPEHFGEPCPYIRISCRQGCPFSAAVTWHVGTRAFQVIIRPGGVECVHVDPTQSTRSYPVDVDLVASVRDGVDWLLGRPLDRGPIPPFNPDGKES